MFDWCSFAFNVGLLRGMVFIYRFPIYLTNAIGLDCIFHVSYSYLSS